MTKRRHLAAAAERALDIDDALHRTFAPYGETRAMAALDLVSKLGDQPELRIVSGAVLLAGIFTGSDRLVRAGARMILAHEAATVAKNLAKTEIDRKRPRKAGTGAVKVPRRGVRTAKEETSFPSGHAAGAMATARAFTREFPEYAPLALGGAALVAAAQVPRCAHYATDVVAGAAVGLVAEAVTNAAWRAAAMDERSESAPG